MLAAVDQLAAIYDQSVDNLRKALAAYVRDRTLPEPEARSCGAFAYPELRIEYDGRIPSGRVGRSFARLSEPGVYATSIARPNLFREYLVEQLEHLSRDYGATISVGRSKSEIPYAYVIENSGIEVGEIGTAELSRFFPSTELAHIGDEIADGVWQQRGDERGRWRCSTVRAPISAWPGCAITPAPRPSISSATCCSPIMSAMSTSSSAGRSSSCGARTAVSRPVGAGRRLRQPRRRSTRRGADRRGRLAAAPDAGLSPDRARGRRGITLVNIGVGPSNAKTICDHLAVLRPEAWLMIGHCGGLRPSQSIGDYVLAHAYLRDDHVLDDVLPTEIPIPAIAEVQQALFDAAIEVTGEDRRGA